MKTILAICCAALAASACGASYKPAEFKAPYSNVSLVLEREPTHAFLAEYDRTLILLVHGKERARIRMSADTGGYSRTNIYKLSDSIYVLSDAADAYVLDVVNVTLKKSEHRETDGQFVGCFDTDDSKEWRFMAASERKEMPAEFRGG
jgi:hypothetical protein